MANYLWKTTFSRFHGTCEEKLTIQFRSHQQSLPEEGMQLKHFVAKAWAALLADSRAEPKDGWSSWLGGTKFERV